MKKSKNVKSYLKSISFTTRGERGNIEKIGNIEKVEDLKELHTTIWNTNKDSFPSFPSFPSILLGRVLGIMMMIAEIETMKKRLKTTLILETGISGHWSICPMQASYFLEGNEANEL